MHLECAMVGPTAGEPLSEQAIPLHASPPSFLQHTYMLICMAAGEKRSRGSLTSLPVP